MEEEIAPYPIKLDRKDFPLIHYPGRMKITLVPIIYKKKIHIPVYIDIISTDMAFESSNIPNELVFYDIRNLFEFIRHSPLYRKDPLTLDNRWEILSGKVLEDRKNKVRKVLKKHYCSKLVPNAVYIVTRRSVTEYPTLYPATEQELELYQFNTLNY